MKAWPAKESWPQSTEREAPVPNQLEPIVVGGELQQQLTRELVNLIFQRELEVVS